MKKRTVVLIGLLVTALVGGGVYGAYRLVAGNGSPVTVTPVAYLNTGSWDYSMPSYGTITANATQEVYLSSDQTIANINVQEGDRVSVGDVLMSYDTTMLELELESAQLNCKTLELQLLSEQKELERLNNITPIADPVDDGSSGAEIVAGVAETAALQDNEVSLMAAAEGTTEDAAAKAAAESEAAAKAAAESEAAAKAAAESEAAAKAAAESEAAAKAAAESEAAAKAAAESEAAAKAAAESEAAAKAAAESEAAAKAAAESEAAKKSAKGSQASDNSEKIEEVDASDLGGNKNSNSSKESETVRYENVVALDELNEKSEPYTGEGTREKPYVFLCKDETIINPSFMNKVKGFTPDGSTKENGGFRGDGSGSYIILEIHVNDDVNSGTQHKIQINGTENNETPFPADQKLIFYADPSTTLEFVEEGTQDSGSDSDSTGESSGGSDTGSETDPISETDTGSGTEVPSETGTESGTEASSEPGTESGTEVPSETGTESGTEASSEPGTESGTEASSETGTESGTEASSEPGTESGTEVSSETSTESGTEAPSETNAGSETEPISESTSGSETEPVSESTSGAETEPVSESNPGTETETPAGETNPGTETETPAGETNPGTETEPATETDTGLETEPVTETETETDSETESETSPLGKIRPHSVLTYNSRPYKGDGTKENPYVFFCMDGVLIRASFMNTVLGFTSDGTTKDGGGFRKDGTGSYVILEIREGDDINSGFVKGIQINGTRKNDTSYDPSTSWIFNSEGLTRVDEEIEQPTTETESESETNWDDWGDWGDWGDDWGDDWGEDVYTVSELKDAIAEKEESIREIQLDIRTANLNLEKAERNMDAAQVKATLNGVVKSVGDPAVGEVDGEAFITVTSDAGLYVTGTISEMDLSKVSTGSTLQGTALESGTYFEAEITEISDYPTSSDYYYDGSGNPNASYYSFTAYIDQADGLMVYEQAEMNIDGATEDTSDSIYIDKRYIRSENGQSYVYKAGSDNTLEKQYVRTGETVYSTYVEVLQGLSLTDSIAFPYGKNVYEGAPIASEDDTGSDTESWTDTETWDDTESLDETDTEYLEEDYENIDSLDGMDMGVEEIFVG